MGQVMRIMTYDRAANERNAVSALQLTVKNGSSVPLHWFRLDDGIMGGQSESNHDTADQVLHFQGTINTQGGGFASIRSKIPEGTLANYQGIKFRLQGDGKTYKFITSRGTGMGGPFSSNPSWQCDIPTIEQNGKDDWQEVVIPFDKLLPSFGGQRRNIDQDQSQLSFDATNMQEIGLMLSLKLSDGSSNPVETFGDGIFPFCLGVQSIVPIEGTTSQTN